MDCLGQTLVVRNTFIDLQSFEPYEAPERTKSDPTGGRTKNVLRFVESPDEQLWQKQQANAPGGAYAQEPAEVENVTECMSAAPVQVGGLHDIVEGVCCADQIGVPYMQENEFDSSATSSRDDYEDSQEDGNLGALGRTKSSAYSHASWQAHVQPSNVHGGWMNATANGTKSMSLNELLPELSQESVNAHSSLDHAYAGFQVPLISTTLGWQPTSVLFAVSGDVSDFATATPVRAAIQQTIPDFATATPDRVAALQQTLAPAVALPAKGPVLPVGSLHCFHEEACNFGHVSPDFRQFTKLSYEGRLTVLAESQIHVNGVHRYLVQFTSGELSVADGVGFMFSAHLPCTKNIQKIVSIFVNQRGRICMRIFADIIRASAHVKPLELGDWVDMTIDLNRKVVTFRIWARTANGLPATSGRPVSTAEFPFGNKRYRVKHKSVELNVGHLACVVKNTGVTVAIGS